MRALLLALTAFLSAQGAFAGDPRVRLQRTPHQGIQPQATVDPKGNVHLLYFHGEPKAGNLFYVRRDAGGESFATPLRVNSQDGSAIAVGTIRGGQLAVDGHGQVHVIWNGSNSAAPKNPIDGVPLLYTRLTEDGLAFEPQRNLMTASSVLDGGGTIAADSARNVFVAWHAIGKGVEVEESKRQVFVSISNNRGQTFSPEIVAGNEPAGVCACCGMRGFAGRDGRVFLLYRTARNGVDRGMALLTSANRGRSFTETALDSWKLNACPMSSASIAEGPGGVYAAWETDGQVYFARIDSKKSGDKAPVPAPGNPGKRKHPTLAISKSGAFLLAWTEGTGWNRGGALAWQLFDKSGRPIGELGRAANAIPVWSLPSAIVEASEQFTIYH